jgi:hypothetical protein
MMALSDSEQRRLDEIERAFADEGGAQQTDHRSEEPGRSHRRLVAVGVLLAGMAVLLVGLVMTAVTLIAGIVVSVVGAGISGAAVFVAGVHRN